MKIGIMSHVLSRESLAESFQRAAQAGAQGVEIMYRAPVAPAALFRQASHADELKALATENNVEIPSICLGFLCDEPVLINPADADKVRRHVQDAMALAVDVGIKTILLPFFGKSLLESEADVSHASQTLAELVEPAEKANVTLALETSLPVAQQQSLMNYLGDSPNMKICFDTGNARARKMDVVTSIRELHNAIACVHFKDVHVAEGAPPDFNVAMGKGSIDFRAVMRSLHAVGYDGWVMLEAPAIGDPVASAAMNLAFTRKLLTELAAEAR